MSHEQTEDLKAFERRLTEVISALHPSASRWRAILTILVILFAFGAWNLFRDSAIMMIPLMHSLMDHRLFTISSLAIILLTFAGIHKRVVAPAIIASRCRLVLEDYNMACDDTGKLILKPRPVT